MYKWLVPVFTAIGLLSACSGGHDLDSPVKTCKTVANQLLPFAIPDNALGEVIEDEARKLTVVLDFAAPTSNRPVQLVCTYAFEDLGPDVEGEYSNTPTGMTINGQTVARRDLFQAVNLATYATGEKVVKEGAQVVSDTMQRINDTLTR